MLTGASVWADDPLLDIDAERWHAPPASQEAIFIGDAKQAPPRLTLSKPALESARTFQLQTDATRLVISDGRTSLSLQLVEESQHALILNGDLLYPRIELNGRQRPALRGRWVRMLLGSESELILTFEDATWANVLVKGRGAQATRLNIPEPQPAPVPQPGRGAATPRPEPPPSGRRSPSRIIDPSWQNGAATPRPAPAAPTGDTSGRAPTATTPAEATTSTASATTATQRLGAAATVRGVQPAAAALPTAGHYPAQITSERKGWGLSFDVEAAVTNAYFYRGIAQENQGTIVQTAASGRLRPFDDPNARVLNTIDLEVGLFASNHINGPSREAATGIGGAERWWEFRWYGGATIGLFERLALSAFYENRSAPSNAYRDVHQVNFKAAFDDYDRQLDFALNPYVLLSMELDNLTGGSRTESDFGNLRPGDNRFGTGVYLELGIEPAFELIELRPNRPLILKTPVRVGLSVSDYFEDDSGEDEMFGFASLGLNFEHKLASIDTYSRQPLSLTWFVRNEFLLLGDSTQRLSQLNGAGGDEFEYILSTGLRLDY